MELIGEWSLVSGNRLEVRIDEAGCIVQCLWDTWPPAQRDIDHLNVVIVPELHMEILKRSRFIAVVAEMT